MAISIKKSSTDALKQTVTSSLPEQVQSQIFNNTKLDTTDYTQLFFKQGVTSEPQKGKRSDDVVQLKFSRGKRAEAKAFFASYDLKMNSGFEIAYEFLKEEVLMGNVKLSRSGIQRLKIQES